MKKLLVPAFIIVIIILIGFVYYNLKPDKNEESERLNIFLNIRKYAELYEKYGYTELDYNILEVDDKEIMKNINDIISNTKFTAENIFSFPLEYKNNVFSIQYGVNEETDYVLYFFDDYENGGLFVHNYERHDMYGYLNSDNRYKLFSIFEQLKNSKTY